MTSSPHRGFSMIEVLVSIVVMAIGLLGLAGLQAQSLRGGHQSLMRTIATIQANDLLERMRANRAAAVAYTANPGANCNATPPVAPTGAALAAYDLCTWNRALRAAIPSAQTLVRAEAGGAYTIRITWTEVGTTERDGPTPTSDLPVAYQLTFRP